MYNKNDIHTPPTKNVNINFCRPTTLIMKKTLFIMKKNRVIYMYISSSCVSLPRSCLSDYSQI